MLRSLVKQCVRLLPRPVRTASIWCYETWFRFFAFKKERREYPSLPAIKKPSGTAKKKNILIYHINGLTFGGTEKNLQTVANSLAEEHNIFFMYSHGERAEYIDDRVQLIPFSYKKKDGKYPYFIHGMNPHIKEVIAKHDIDLIITADAGHAQYPFHTILDIPIILINIFGSPALQKNIDHIIYISHEVKQKAEFYTGPKTSSVLYIPSEDPLSASAVHPENLREKFGIAETDIVFGRIGRNADSIFDPIGIRAFQRVVQNNPTAHYLIMSPPPIVEQIAQDEQIPNVHFIAPSSKREDVWAFHHAIDALAHFRFDGESCGLNIAESMLVGNPIITHRSHIWNAHTEYLEDSFSRIAQRGAIDEYAGHMEEFIATKAENPQAWQEMRAAAGRAGHEHFSTQSYAQKIGSIVDAITQ